MRWWRRYPRTTISAIDAALFFGPFGLGWVLAWRMAGSLARHGNGHHEIALLGMILLPAVWWLRRPQVLERFGLPADEHWWVMSRRPQRLRDLWLKITRWISMRLKRVRLTGRIVIGVGVIYLLACAALAKIWPVLGPWVFDGVVACFSVVLLIGGLQCAVVLRRAVTLDRQGTGFSTP